MSNIKKIAFPVSRVVVSCLLVFLLVQKVDIHSAYQLFGEVDILYLILALLMMSLSVWVIGLRMSMLTGASIKTLFPVQLKISFFNQLSPAQLGGDFFKLHFLNKVYASKTKAMATVFAERIMGIIGLLVLVVCNVVIGKSYFIHGEIYTGVILYIALCTVLILLLFAIPRFRFQSPRLAFVNKGLQYWSEFLGISKTLFLRFFIKSLPYTLISNLFLILLRIFSMKALHLPIDFGAAFVYVPVISMAVITFPISFNGLGVRESLSVLFFTMAGYSSTESLAMAFITLFCVLTISLSGGVLLLYSSIRNYLLPSFNKPNKL